MCDRRHDRTFAVCRVVVGVLARPACSNRSPTLTKDDPADHERTARPVVEPMGGSPDDPDGDGPYESRPADAAFWAGVAALAAQHEGAAGGADRREPLPSASHHSRRHGARPAIRAWPFVLADPFVTGRAGRTGGRENDQPTGLV